jgi:outer membrane receptor for monomeric catechols
MSQNLYFYKQKIFSEEICRNFTHDEINSSVKALLKKHDLEENEDLRNAIFEELEPNLILISAYHKSIEKFITKTRFISPKSKFFMVSNKILAAIEKVVQSQEKSNYSESQTSQVFDDLSTLKELCEKKLLFINIQ